MKNLKNIIIFSAVMFSGVQAIGFDDFEKAREISLSQSQKSSQVLSNRHIWSAVTADSNFLSTSRLGTSLTLGYQFEFFGVDTRLHIASGKYETIKTTPGYSDTPSNDQPSSLQAEEQESELNRIRRDDDMWSYTLVEPGFSVSGKWLPFSIQNMTETARVGFGIGRFTDNANAFEFKAYIFSVESSLNYQIGSTPFSVTGGISWHTGTLILDNEVKSQNIKRLNANWMSSSIGVMYWY